MESDLRCHQCLIALTEEIWILLNEDGSCGHSYCCACAPDKPLIKVAAEDYDWVINQLGDDSR